MHKQIYTYMSTCGHMRKSFCEFSPLDPSTKFKADDRKKGSKHARPRHVNPRTHETIKWSNAQEVCTIIHANQPTTRTSLCLATKNKTTTRGEKGTFKERKGEKQTLCEKFVWKQNMFTRYPVPADGRLWDCSQAPAANNTTIICK